MMIIIIIIIIIIVTVIVTITINNHDNVRENNRSYVLHTNHRVETVARR